MTRSYAAAFAMVFVACANEDSPGPTERWQVLAKTTIQETDATYIALPTLAYASDDGDIYVSDVQQGTVWRIGRDGAIVRSFGSRGSGPGEFRVPGRVARVADTVFTENTTRNRLLMFSPSTGDFLGEKEAPLRVEQLLVVGGRLFAASEPDPDGRFLAPLGQGQQAIERLGWAPSILRNDEMLASAFGASATHIDGEDVISVFQLSDSIYRSPLRAPEGKAHEADAELIPVRIRRGARSDLVQRAKSDPDAAAEVVYGTSIPFAVSGGAQSPRVLYYDPERVNGRMLGRYVLAWRTRDGWCEDVVPLVDDPRPALALRGDTIFAISQAADSTEKVSTRVEILLLSNKSGCP